MQIIDIIILKIAAQMYELYRVYRPISTYNKIDPKESVIKSHLQFPSFVLQIISAPTISSASNSFHMMGVTSSCLDRGGKWAKFLKVSHHYTVNSELEYNN